MFSTIIEFASNPEIVNAQTFDSAGFIALLITLIFIGAGVLFACREKAFAVSGSKGLHITRPKIFASKKFYAAVIVAVVAIAGMFVFSVNRSASAANGLNVAATDKVIGVVNEQTGEVAIDQAIVTNDEGMDLEFNSVSLELFPGINDGQCNWKISIAKNDEEDAEVVFDDVANNHNIFYEPWQFEKGQKYTVTFEVTMDPAVAKSLEGQQIATLTYDITEPQERVNATINFNEKSITPAGKKVIEKNGWIESPGNGTYQAKKVKGSQIAPELVPFEQSMSDGDIFKTYMKFSSWTITEDLEKFTKDVSISANWVDRDGLRGFVVGSDGKPVEGAKVTAYDKDSGEILGELYTDDNGKYIFEFPPLPLGKDIIITTENEDPNLVAPSKEFHSYEPGGELGTSTANDSSSLKGHVNGLPSSPTTWAVFHADDGNDYYAPVDKNGNYNLPVPADTPGNLFFENSDPSLNIEAIPNIDTPSKGGSSQLPDSGVMPKENMATVKYTLNPATEGARLVVTQYDPKTKTEHSYSATTDKDGKVKMPVWPGMNGDVEISFYDPFSKQNVSYAESIDALEIGETYDKPIDASNVYSVRLSKTDKDVQVTHIPNGWIFDGENSYDKAFIGGSDIATITKQWNPDYFIPAHGRVFSGFTEEAGILNKSILTEAIWRSESSRYTVSGTVTDTSGKPIKGIKVSLTGGEAYQCWARRTTNDEGKYTLYVTEPGLYFINATGYTGKYKDYASKSSNFEIKEASHEYTFNFVINPCSYILGNYQFSGTGATFSIFTFKDAQGNEYKNDEVTTGSYTLRVPLNTKGQIIGEPVNFSGDPYKTLSYDITTSEAGESVTRDFNFYKTGYKLTCNFGAHEDLYVLIWHSEEEGATSVESIVPETQQYTITVPPKSEWDVYVSHSVTGQIFTYKLLAGNDGETKSVTVSFTSFHKLTVTITNGTFDESKLADRWAMEAANIISTSNFADGSNIDTCLSELEEAIIPSHNYYFKFFDKGTAGDILQEDTDVKCVCGSYIYGPEKFYQDGAEAGSIQILGEMTEAAKGLRIVPFASSVLLYDSNDQLQTIVSAVYNDTKFWSLAPTSWSFNDTATEESGYIQSQICATPTSSNPADTFNVNLNSGGLFSADDIAKLQKVFHKDSETSWSMRFTNQYPAESWLVRDVMNFLNIVPVREGFEFAGWYIPEVIKGDNPVLARWVPVSEANGITRENIIVPVDDEGYQEALAALQSNEDSE